MEACGKFSNLTLTMILYNISCFWHSPIRAWRVYHSQLTGKECFVNTGTVTVSIIPFFFLLESSYDHGLLTYTSSSFPFKKVPDGGFGYVRSVVMQDLKTGFLKSIKMFHVKVQMLRNFPTPYHCFSLCNKFMYSYTQN